MMSWISSNGSPVRFIFCRIDHRCLARPNTRQLMLAWSISRWISFSTSPM